jgi:protein-tyrosine phosphatase
MYSIRMQFQTDSPTRRIELKGAFNFRDLGGYQSLDGRRVRWRRVFRADNLSLLTDQDHGLLAELSLATVIDLRTNAELERRGRIRPSVNYEYHHIPMADVLPDTTDPRWSSPEYVASRYGDMLADAGPRIRTVLEIIADPSEHPVVFHCAAGKDRTGIVAAIVLGLLGVRSVDIVADYALTGSAMERMVAYWTQDDPERAERIRPHLPAITATREENVAGFLDLIGERYGSVEGYARAIGAQSAITGLRASLLA